MSRTPHAAPTHGIPRRAEPLAASRGAVGRTRARVVALTTAAVLALAGCSTALPTTTVPQPGLPVDLQPRQDVQRLLPRPQAGATQSEIVSGFLRANVGFAEDDDVAREYLTPELASAWVPTSNVLVLDGTPVTEVTDPGVVSVTAQVRGRIDESGRLVEQPAGTSTTQSFQLTPVAGEWRISAFPDGFGLWLSSTDLERSFRAHAVYYLERSLRTFVPDIRWLARGEGEATSLARAQLAPPPAYLGGAVSTGSTPEMRLAVTAVPVDPNTQVATVNLQGSGLAEDTTRIADLRAQLGRALLAVSGVSGVDLRVAGRSVGAEPPVTAETDLGYEDVHRDIDQALLRVRDRFVLVSPGQYELRDLPKEQTEALGLPTLGIVWSGVAASADLTSLAAVNRTRTALWRWAGGAETVNEGIADHLTDPTYDPHGMLWVAGSARGTGTPRFWWSPADDVAGLARPVDVPFLDADDRVTTLRISPDGTRALMVVGTPEPEGAERVLVVGILRDAEGNPTGLAEATTAAHTLTQVQSARWASTSELLVTGQRADDPRPLAFRVPLGGWIASLGELNGLVDATPVPTGQGYRPVVRTEDGRFHTTEGAGWYEARNGDELIIPGS